jgi:hypothetical protein
MALDLFRARAVDPRVQGARWLADALVEYARPGGYEAAASGILDADTIWNALLPRALGLPDGRPDALALLRWTGAPGAVERYLALPAEFRDGNRVLQMRMADVPAVRQVLSEPVRFVTVGRATS